MPTTIGTKTLKKDVRKRSPKIDMDRLVELARERNDDGTFMSHQEIADKMGVARPSITRALQRVPEWQLKERDVETYKRDRADMFAMAQQLIMQHITADKLKAASLQQLGTLFGIMYDKERLERGQATQHIAEISSIKLDKETMMFINKAIEARTRSLLGKSKITFAEPESSPGDSGGSVVSNSEEIDE